MPFLGVGEVAALGIMFFRKDFHITPYVNHTVMHHCHINHLPQTASINTELLSHKMYE